MLSATAPVEFMTMRAPPPSGCSPLLPRVVKRSTGRQSSESTSERPRPAASPSGRPERAKSLQRRAIRLAWRHTLGKRRLPRPSIRTKHMGHFRSDRNTETACRETPCSAAIPRMHIRPRRTRPPIGGDADPGARRVVDPCSLSKLHEHEPLGSTPKADERPVQSRARRGDRGRCRSQPQQKPRETAFPDCDAAPSRPGGGDRESTQHDRTTQQTQCNRHRSFLRRPPQLADGGGTLAAVSHRRFQHNPFKHRVAHVRGEGVVPAKGTAWHAGCQPDGQQLRSLVHEIGSAQHKCRRYGERAQPQAQPESDAGEQTSAAAGHSVNQQPGGGVGGQLVGLPAQDLLRKLVVVVVVAGPTVQFQLM